MPQASRIGDMHSCPAIHRRSVPIPHVGGPILGPGMVSVLIGGRPAAVAGNKAACNGPKDRILRGSGTVIIGGRPAARFGDLTAHGGIIIAGCPTVIIGG